MNYPDGSTGPFLIFQSSGLDCAFALKAVHEVVPMAALFAPPGMPSGITGFLDLRGQAIPILRLDLLFDLPEQRPGRHTPIILLRVAGNLIGILAESIRQIASPLADSWLPRDAKSIFHECAVATFVIDERLTHLLAADGILLEHERRLVSEFQTVAQERLRLLEVT